MDEAIEILTRERAEIDAYLPEAREAWQKNQRITEERRQIVNDLTKRLASIDNALYHLRAIKPEPPVDVERKDC